MFESCLPTPEMITKLNLEVVVTSQGLCLSSKTRNKPLLDELIEKGYIEPYHAEYGISLHSLREVWLGNLNCRSLPIYDFMRVLRNVGHPTEIYDNVVRITKPLNVKIILWAIQAPKQTFPASVGDVIRKSFERLADAFIETHKLLAEQNKIP